MRRPSAVCCLVLAALACAPVASCGENAPVLLSDDIVYLRALLTARIDGDADDAEKQLARETLRRLDGTRTFDADEMNRAETEAHLKNILRAELARNPRGRQPRLDLARFSLYLDDAEHALRHLQHAGPGSKHDLFWPLLIAYAHFRLGEQEKGAPYLERTVRSARALVPLRLENGAFCERVTGLGQYMPYPDDLVSAGQAVFLYFEVAGAVFREGEDGMRGPSLRLSLEIRDEMQETRWRKDDFASHTPLYRRVMSEIYCAVHLVMPKTLQPGPHVLILTCEDEYGDQDARLDVPFSIAYGTSTPE